MSAAEYIVATVLVGITGIIGYRSLGTKLKCKLNAATGLFGVVNGATGSSVPPECEDPDSGGGSGGSGGSSSAPGGDPGSCPGGLCMLPDGCFVAGTPVLTESGWLPIEAVVPGMQVRSRPDRDDGDTVVANDWKPVTRTFVHWARPLVALTVVDADGGTESLRLTSEHRVHVEGRGWVAAAELVAGRDILLDADGTPLEVAATESLPDVATVFNFEVADDHTYFVGQHAVWVHNGCKKGDHIYNNGYTNGVFKDQSSGTWDASNCAANNLASALSNVQNNLRAAEKNCQITVDKPDDGSSSNGGDENSQRYGAANQAFKDAMKALVTARKAYDDHPNFPDVRANLDEAVANASAAAQTLHDEAYDAAAEALVKDRKDKEKLALCKAAVDEANRQVREALKEYGSAPDQRNPARPCKKAA